MATPYTEDFMGRPVLPAGDERGVAIDFLGRAIIGVGPGSTDYLGRELLAGEPV